ncbi:MAG: ShlB/FhaC/HecB family hemolysin secretion/activation protein [Candidatus Competibacteraceae bacterium]
MKMCRIPIAGLMRICAAAGLFLLNPNQAGAQLSTFPENYPNENRPPLPSYRSPTTPTLTVPPPPSPSTEPLSAQARVFVRRFQLSGNTVFSDRDLAQVTAPYENRTITSEELQEVRHKLTLYYVERGYINSGALIPDQKLTDGVVHIQIIEGKLSGVDISGNDWLRTSYIQNRLGAEPDQVLNVQELQQRLQLLQQNPLLEGVNGELMPGLRPGESQLRLVVREATPYEVGMIFANDRPPQVGSKSLQLYALHRNLTGWGDSIGIYYDYGLDQKGTNGWNGYYTLPLNAYDTTFKLWADQEYSEVIDDPFDLNITSRIRTYGIGLAQPLYRTPQQTFSMGVNLELRRSVSYLDGERFSFALGSENGEAKETPLRLYQEWLDRDLQQVIAARSTLSIGLDAFDATQQHGSIPDGQFVTWLAQFQWARQLSDWGLQAIFRTDLQLSNRSLLSMEQCAVGGSSTVRGYRENELVRDECFIASLEFRVPVLALPVPGLSRGAGDGLLQLAPFVDYGRGWNKTWPTPSPKSISSAGLGLRWDISPSTRAAVYWGHPFDRISNGGADHDLQDRGISFFVQLAYP